MPNLTIKSAHQPDKLMVSEDRVEKVGVSEKSLRANE